MISGSATTNISFAGVRPSDAGEYRLTVTFPMTQPNNDAGNPNNCVHTSTIYRTLVVNPLPVLAGPDEVCAGQSINWTPNSGGTWITSNPAIATITNDGLVTGISEGTVTFTFTETSTGCSSTTDPVTVHPLPTGVISDNSAICAGQSTTFTVNLTGTAPWNITYTDGTTPVTVNGITASPHTITVSPSSTSTYTLTAISDAHCNATSMTGSAVVTVYPLPTAVVSGNTTICVGSSANLSVALTGAQPWSITYTDGVTPVTVSGITSSPHLIAVSPSTTTSYSLTAVSDVHCTGTSFTGTATVTVDQLPTASAGGSETICSNGTATVSGATSSNGTIVWTHDGAGTLTDETTLTPVYTANLADEGKTVTLTLTVTSNNACSTVAPATATYSVVVEPLPVAIAGGSETICAEGIATVSGANAANGNLLWTHDGTGTLSEETTLTPVYTAGPSDSGNTVTLTLTVTSNNACSPQTAAATFTINVLPEAQVNQPDNQEICNSTSTAMITYTTTNTTGSTTYSWTNSEPSIGLAASGSGNIIAPFTAVNSGIEPIIATVTVTPHLTIAGLTCDGPEKTFTITVNPEPRVTAPIGLIFCNGILTDPYPLTGTPTGVLFDISGGASIGLADVAGVSSIPAFTPTNAGTATLTVTPKFKGCTGLPVSFNVTVRPTPTATLSGGATVCQNSAPPGIVITNPMNLAVVVTYTINGVSQTVNVLGRSNVSIGVSTNAAGVFTYELVSVQYLDSNPPTCANTSVTGTAIVEVTALPVPQITGPTNICAETTGNVYQTEAGMSNYTWVVSAAGTITAGGTSTDNTVTVTWNSGGSHNISVRYNNTNGCLAATPTVLPVNVFPLPIPTITGSTSACLNASRIYSTQPGMSNYLWDVSAGGTVTSGGGTSDNSITITWSAEGAQTVSVNYTNGNNCTAAAPTVRNVTVNPLPAPTITGPASVCVNSTGHVYQTETLMTNYIWTVSAGGVITAGGTGNETVTVTWTTTGAKTVTVNYTNGNNCTAAIATVYNVTVNALPVPTIAGPSPVCVTSTGNLYQTEAGMTNYLWLVTGGTITAGGGTGDATATVTWNTAGSQTISVNYTNGNSCTAASATVRTITVYPLPVPTISGNGAACLNSTGNIYTTEAGMTNYTWVVTGGTATAGGTNADNTATVTWTTLGAQSVSVNYTNGNNCTAAAPTVRSVTVNPLPVPTITGPAAACATSTGNVYSTEAGMSSYSWTVSAGGTITAGGSGSSSITVTWNTAGAQTVSVNYINGNGCTAVTPATYNVTVNPLPVPAIAGPVPVCVTSTGNLYTTAAGMTNYIWTVSAGGTITAGGTNTDNTVTVTWNTVGAQTVRVNYTNAFGCTATTATTFTPPNPV